MGCGPVCIVRCGAADSVWQKQDIGCQKQETGYLRGFRPIVQCRCGCGLSLTVLEISMWFTNNVEIGWHSTGCHRISKKKVTVHLR